jgi:hypothetical protein
LIARESGALLSAPAFLREPFKHIELRFSGQALFVFPSLIPGFEFDLFRPFGLAGSHRAKYQRSTSAQRA